MFTAIALARRGRAVTVVDRDPGPPPSGPDTFWQRKGVMQFHHAHTFRSQVVEALRAELPDVLDDLVTAGATIATTAEKRPVALLCRRTTFERVLWNLAAAQQGVTLLCGHVDGIEHDRGRAVGVMVDRGPLRAGLLIDASGRSSRFTDGIRPPAEGGDCGAVYVTRQYRLLDRADAGPMNSPIGLSLGLSGYWAIAFLHDNGAFSITFTHDGTDKRLRLLRRDEVFDDAVRAIPLLGEWIDSSRAQPISRALPGGRLYNTYRGQLDGAGRPVLPGLISVGDAVCTTTPLAGRGHRRPPTVAVRPDRCGGSSRPSAEGPCRPVHHHGRTALQPGTGSSPRQGNLRGRVAPAGSGRPDPRGAQLGVVQDTGSRLMPWMNGDSSLAGSSVA